MNRLTLALLRSPSLSSPAVERRVKKLLSFIFLSLFFYPFSNPLFPPQVKKGATSVAMSG
jgi:hypothetical protein